MLESGGGQAAQQACMIPAAVHYKHDKMWLVRADLTTVCSFGLFAVRKQFQSLRDRLGRLIFHVGPADAASVRSQLR